MSSQEAQHSVATMSRLLEVSRSGFYAWAERGSSQRACQDLVLSTGIQRIHEYSRGTYGAPRIHADEFCSTGGAESVRARRSAATCCCDARTAGETCDEFQY